METIHLGLFLVLCLGADGLSSEILQRQKRNWIIESFTIDEGYKGVFPYLLGRIHVEKNLTLFKIHGQGVDEEPKGILEIDAHTGDITVNGPVDYERFKELKLMFLALDRESKVINTRLGIEIDIIDANDNPPRFDNMRYIIKIKESTLQGTALITVRATDGDSHHFNNKIFDLRIVSVTPKPDELQFYLTQDSGAQTGTISFKGCLDHEKVEKYSIIVEAKDRGEQVQLSSTCTVIIDIEDGNNHIPVITQQTGQGRVKEGQENFLVSRLQVTDEDTKGSEAWRAKYRIHGDTNNNFNITTDPQTNEGLLYVVKRLDYEDGPLRNVTISVENEIPFFSCKVESRRTIGLWKVTTTNVITGRETGAELAIGSSSRQVTVIVEDVNEPPVFHEPHKKVQLFENVDAGHYLTTFTAKDPDVSSANTFVYKKGRDPADWVTVDPNTGKITTSKIMDRESNFVNDSIYEVTVYAVDNGKPPATSTATLSIHVIDKNDNVPSLTVSTFDMCLSDGPSRANITVVDPDEAPYGGPFTFKLQGDVEGKWKVDPVQGYSLNLVKEDTVHPGHYELFLEVSDLQGETAVHGLSVTVCKCAHTKEPNCHSRKSTATAEGQGYLSIMFFSILLLAGVLLLVFRVSCKSQQQAIFQDDVVGHHLMKSNTEEPGTDCQAITKLPTVMVSTSNAREVSCSYQKQNNLNWLVPDSASDASEVHAISQGKYVMGSAFLQRKSTLWSTGASSTMRMSHGQKHYMHGSTGASSTMRMSHGQKDYMHGSTGASSTMRMSHGQKDYMHGGWVEHHKYSDQQNTIAQRRFVLQRLNENMHNLKALEAELDEYTPHVYAEEGEAGTSFELDAISISDTAIDLNLDLDLDLDLDVDLKFSTLASICMASESTAYTTVTSSVMTKHRSCKP